MMNNKDENQKQEEQQSYSSEPIWLQNVLKEIDRLWGTGFREELEAFLQESLSTAMGNGDTASVLVILNEMIGFYRDICDYDTALLLGSKTLAILDASGLAGTVHHATTLINIGNAARAAGKCEEALVSYRESKRIYESLLPENAFEFAGLYNNMSLVYMEQKDYQNAYDTLEKALSIATAYPEKQFEQAVSEANLANTMLQMPEEAVPGRDARAEELLLLAVSYFERANVIDTHYAAALSGLGELAEKKGCLFEAANYYRRGMAAIRGNMGITDSYYRMKERYDFVTDMLKASDEKYDDPEQKKGLSLCTDYYLKIVLPILKERCGSLLEHMMVGMVGEGSDCYGYDDAISRDHDWGPAVTIWLSDEDYELHGKKLSKLLEELPHEYDGFCRNVSAQAKGRVGVWRLSDFLAHFLGKEVAETLLRGEALSPKQWLSLSQISLSAVTNGALFLDMDETFVRIRKYLSKGYPESIRRKMMAQSCALFSQNAQYNFGRMLQRGERQTALFFLQDGIRELYQIGYLLERKYMPHSKWMIRGSRNFDILWNLEEYGNEIWNQGLKIEAKNVTDAMLRPLQGAIQKAIHYLQREMISQGLIHHKYDYLEDAAMELMENADQADRLQELEQKDQGELVELVIKAEWEAFDQVQNEGGRASCQDDWNTFHLMRASQYLVWTKEMLVTYLLHFEQSMALGRNLITEKYGRMEISTAPEEYAKIEHAFPVLSKETKAIIEEVVRIQVQWMEEFAEKYPHMAGNARSIHTYEDNPYNTSYETYLRGELSTYSSELLAMYAGFVVEIARAGKNLAYDIMENTAHLYGYKSLEDAEASLQG